jgi:hypothetical protein
MAEETQKTDRSDFLATMRAGFKRAAEEEAKLREEATTDLKFEAGDQWDAAIKNQRVTAGRPALTFSRCHTFVQQISNEARQRRGEIKFVAADNGDSDTPEVLEGLARHIQYNSEARVAYETAVEYSAACGFGYYRFLTDYCDDEGFDQELKVVTVHDPMSVYGVLLPTCYGVEPTRAWVVENLTKDEYEAKYGGDPDKPLYGGNSFEEATHIAEDWITEETVRVAEYWYVELKPKTITKGKRSRTVIERTVKCVITNGVEVLEETVWPGKMIPIFAVLGKKRIVEGQLHLFGVIRFQRDPQRMINFYKSGIAERIQQSPVAPYIGVVGQFEGLEEKWQTANTAPRPYLEVNPVDVNGNPAPLPKREVAEPPIAALSNAAALEIDDMKATSGIYDASLGNQSNETSGIAIQRRQQESDSTNMHFLDNLERSFDVSGRELACCIPVVYDAPRMVRILGPDDTAKIVAINQATKNDKGQPVHYNIGGDEAVKYDVIVTMGRSFSTKRMESFDMMSSVIQANPNVFPMIADIFFKNSDLAGADQLAERFKQLGIKQGFIQDDSQQNQIPPQAQAQMQALSQQNQQLTAELHKALDPVEAKRMEMDARFQMAKLEADTRIAIAEIQTKAQMTSEREARLTEVERDLHEQAHEVALTTMKAEHGEIAANNAAGRQAALQAQQPEPQASE